MTDRDSPDASVTSRHVKLPPAVDPRSLVEGSIRHGACGKWWTGPSNGHCGKCHETFSSGAFDKHQRIHNGVIACSTEKLVAHPMPWGTLWRKPGGYQWPRDGH